MRVGLTSMGDDRDGADGERRRGASIPHPTTDALMVSDVMLFLSSWRASHPISTSISHGARMGAGNQRRMYGFIGGAVGSLQWASIGKPPVSNEGRGGARNGARPASLVGVASVPDLSSLTSGDRLFTQ